MQPLLNDFILKIDDLWGTFIFCKIHNQGVINKFFYEEVRSRLWSSTHKKQLGICIEYTYISELMLWLHQGKFVNIKWVKIPSLAALQVAKYMRTVK